MKKFFVLFLLAPAMFVGCEPAPSTEGTTSTESTTPAEEGAETEASTADASTVTLNGENTTIQFTGLHKGDEPNPRVGVFETVNGTASVADGKLVKMELTIDTDSLSIIAEESGLDADGKGKLEGHLKNADFYNVAQFPTAKFNLTRVVEVDGKFNLVGDLTLLEETKSITIPATVSTESGLSIDAETEIDRMEFGMDFGAENIEEKVKLKITVKAE